MKFRLGFSLGTWKQDCNKTQLIKRIYWKKRWTPFLKITKRDCESCPFCKDW